ncbi:LOW QUALITY PROTEIN: hORC2L [Coccidioides immitis RMSCC 3703]|uniref:Origin recognition complex subunit 2 n=1 Tax=Coccidioides immitis RMSCC 3703 TaxID=454286 RepID=A0A0J8R921_COCIT|nr:LOW QUALITY PROTEIN: hORC2L [Coccidioides immitis RMSCC 3703]
MKRKQSLASSDDDPLQVEESTPRKRRASPDDPETPQTSTPLSRLRSRSKPNHGHPPVDSPTPKPKRKPVFSTPNKTSKSRGIASDTPSRIKNADRSAKKKSAAILFNPNEDDLWNGGEKLAREIWDIEEETEGEDEINGILDTNEVPEAAKDGLNKSTGAPGCNRQPRTRARRRTPTPDGDLPSHERYFFQNRPGPMLTSDNTLSKLTLLTHEEYFDQLEKLDDPQSKEKEALVDIHERSFPQWNFELIEGDPPTMSCEWLCDQCYSQIYSATIISAVMGPEAPTKLGTQLSEVLDVLQSNLNVRPPKHPITVLINSIDAPPLRRQAHQTLLARLASLPHINIVATADTPNFLLLWDIGLRDQFNFAFHDCTTFAPYDAELNVVDEVHSLLGRKVRRIGGKQGVGFVLKSLPENTRKLYRLLITELLTMLGDQNISEGEVDQATTDPRDKTGNERRETAIEWRTLFHKAREDFSLGRMCCTGRNLNTPDDHLEPDSSGAEMLGSLFLKRRWRVF